MEGNQKASKVSSASGKRQGGTSSSNRPQGARRSSGKGPSSSDRLKAKEDEYRRMNAELEAKTTELVKEAEELLEGNLSIISDLEGSHTEFQQPSQSHGSTRSRDLAGGAGGSAKLLNGEPKLISKKPNKRPNTTNSSKKPHTQQPKRPITSHHIKLKPLSHDPSHDLSHDTMRIDSALLATIQRLESEGGGESGGGGGNELALLPVTSSLRTDVLPPTVDDMGAEATIRFLKAKLKVMQEEMDQLCEESNNKDKLILAHEGRIKELETSKAKLQSSVQSTANHLEKHKKSAEEFKQKCLGLEGQLTATRKELDSLKSSQKKSLSQHSAVEVRLNRALEEAERYKDALHKVKADAKEVGQVDKLKLDRLVSENKQLEKQRSEIMVAFKKQLRLIDILKRQKMHIEAAKMLSFTEEEFVKALDWGTASS